MDFDLVETCPGAQVERRLRSLLRLLGQAEKRLRDLHAGLPVQPAPRRPGNRLWRWRAQGRGKRARLRPRNRWARPGH